MRGMNTYLAKIVEMSKIELEFKSVQPTKRIPSLSFRPLSKVTPPKHMEYNIKLTVL